MTVESDRFDYATNLGRAGTYQGHRGAFWPPSGSYLISGLDLTPHVPDLGDDFRHGLAGLRDVVGSEWVAAKDRTEPSRRFARPEAVADAVRRIGASLPGAADRRAAELRAGAVVDGYDDAVLGELGGIEEDIAVVAGLISTWYGKERAGLPTAFACRRDQDADRAVADAGSRLDAVAGLLAGLHADLRLREVPRFVATRLFFMAGEGDLHPKHIAYFLPEDEGVAGATSNKTYYFANTHRTLLERVSAPLARRHLDLDVTFDPADARFSLIPTLGVLGHEVGHSVHRPATTFQPLHLANRWVSAVLQEVAADVFGILVLAEVWASEVGFTRADAAVYHLAECLRYVDRGLGCFPDSDGMYLQLSYLVELGGLTVEHGQHARLRGDAETVLAGLRSLARTLADTLLTGTADDAVALYDAFGPGRSSPLGRLVDDCRQRPFPSVEYVQRRW